MHATSWLLLLYSLPTRQKTERVAVWRRFKKIGAIQIKTSTYLLPDEPAQYEQFQWLAQQIRDYGGDSTLVRVQEIEGLNKEKVVAMFNDVRAKDYGELRKALQSFIARRKKWMRKGQRQNSSGSRDSFGKFAQSISSTVRVDTI